MSRAQYSEDLEPWALIRWRGAVASAMRGKRGQAFLRELLAALDALPVKELIAGEFATDGAVCALGSVGRARGMDMTDLDPEGDPGDIAAAFGIPRALAAEIMFWNDDCYLWRSPTAAQRFAEVRALVVEQLRSA